MIRPPPLVERQADRPDYYSCGTAQAELHQPGFSLAAVRWLIDHHILGRQGALGIDTFGPDPGTDEEFRESSLVLHRHRLTLENLTGLGQLPRAVIGSSSAAPATTTARAPRRQSSDWFPDHRRSQPPHP
jgi:kynurenine formamidase